MRPNLIGVHPPRFNRLLRVVQADEPALVQALIADAPIEALGEGVLDGLARLNEVPRDALEHRPLVQRVSTKLRAVVTDNRRWQPVRHTESLEVYKNTQIPARVNTQIPAVA